MSKAKEVLLFELDEQSHPERVEDVIYWALKYYYENRKKGTWGETIAYYLVKTIEEAEGKMSENNEANKAMGVMNSEGVKLITKERERQIDVKGWSEEHDKQHNRGELSDLAACYALRPYWRKRISTPMINPFAFKDFKPDPNNRVRELTKAGALIAAEIDRLLNKESEDIND